MRIRLLESIISQLATNVQADAGSRAEETGLSLVLSETPKTGPEVIFFFVLNPAEHETLTAHKN